MLDIVSINPPFKDLLSVLQLNIQPKDLIIFPLGKCQQSPHYDSQLSIFSCIVKYISQFIKTITIEFRKQNIFPGNYIALSFSVMRKQQGRNKKYSFNHCVESTDCLWVWLSWYLLVFLMFCLVKCTSVRKVAVKIVKHHM